MWEPTEYPPSVIGVSGSHFAAALKWIPLFKRRVPLVCYFIPWLDMLEIDGIVYSYYQMPCTDKIVISLRTPRAASEFKLLNWRNHGRKCRGGPTRRLTGKRRRNIKPWNRGGDKEKVKKGWKQEKGQSLEIYWIKVYAFNHGWVQQYFKLQQKSNITVAAEVMQAMAEWINKLTS